MAKVKLISENISGDGITVITEDAVGNRQIIFNKSINEVINQDALAKPKEEQYIEKHSE